jgi:LasA protease
MKNNPSAMRISSFVLFLAILFTAGGCSGKAQQEQSDTAPQVNPLLTYLPPTLEAGAPIYTPTPDDPHASPVLYEDGDSYVVQVNDTLVEIAQKYDISIITLSQHNNITDRDHLEVGQVIKIPKESTLPFGPDFKIIPNSELVNSPSSLLFSTKEFLAKYNGYLAAYQETLEDKTYTGAEVVERVSRENSVHPRILLAVLEYQSHWVTQPQPDEATLDFPMQFHDPNRMGLYKQLSWAADQLNLGYYLWETNAGNKWTLIDNSVIAPSPLINAGTAGVQQLMTRLYDSTDWQTAVGSHGVFDTYINLFGYPFLQSIEPLTPPDLLQPSLQLPFEPGVQWYLTGGPHGGWGDGSAWAALDFAPPGESDGCAQSDAWVTAMASGRIVYTGNGLVIEDLERDGYEQIGWALIYMHVESRDRILAGTDITAGERIGHPSCEGGVSTGTHVHVARKYNGVWISADASIPFEMDGWISKGDGTLYEGSLMKGNEIVDAWDSRKDENKIQR